MKMRKDIVKLIFIITLILICLTGCQKQNESDIKDKLNSEISYLEDLIFKIANKYTKNEYVEDDEINWQYIKDDVEKINSSWPILVLDLTNVNVANDEIMAYGNDLNNLLIAISNEDEIVMIDKLSNMYQKIVVFKEFYSENKNQVKKNKIKSGVLNIYNLINKNNIAEAKNLADALIEEYHNLMKEPEYVKDNSYNMNKINILLEEYRNSIEINNLDLIRLKYITVVEEL